MVDGTLLVHHSLNNVGRESCFIRMADPPYEFIHIKSIEGDLVHWESANGYGGAMILRDQQAAEKFIEDNNMYGYKAIRCIEILGNDGSEN